jgi:beta-lactamase regulating signal transducer with metallopeptidase domain
MDTLVRFPLTLLMDASIKSAALLVTAGIVSLGLRRASAACRHRIWLLTLASLLCLPLLSAALPGWQAPVLPRSLSRGAIQLSAKPRPNAAGSIDAAGHPVRAAVTVAVREHGGAGVAMPRMWQECVLLVWLAGLVLVVAHVLGGLLLARRLTRRVRCADDPGLLEAAAQARAALDVRRPISLRFGVSPFSITVPMTTGVRHPIIVLPEDAAGWPVERLYVVLLHELAHVKRRDSLSQLLTYAACAVYWFNPLVWRAWHRLRAEAEYASDDLALACGVKPSEYARHLWEIVRGLSRPPRLSAAAVTVTGGRAIQARLKAIVAVGSNRTVMTRRATVMAILGAGCLLGPLATLRPAAVALEAAPGAADEPRANVVSIAPGYRHTFANGVTLEVLAVTEPRAEGGKWWKPNGLPLAEPPTEAGHQAMGFTGWKIADHPRGIVFGITTREDTTANYVGYVSRRRAAGAPGVRDVREFGPGELRADGTSILTVIHAFRDRPGTCTYRLGVAAGRWETVATASWDPGQVTGAAPVDIAVLTDTDPRLVYQDPGGGQHSEYFLPRRPALGDVARRLVAVDLNGDTSPLEWRGGWRRILGGELALVVSSQELKQVRQIRLQTRPYQYVEFRNIALRSRTAALRADRAVSRREA